MKPFSGINTTAGVIAVMALKFAIVPQQVKPNLRQQILFIKRRINEPKS